MQIGEMLVTLGFKVEHEKLSKVEQQLEGIKRRLEFLAAAEIVRGLVELGEKFGEFAEKIHVAANSAGLTVEEFQKLTFAGKQSAVGADELGLAMFRLSRHLYDARNGSAEANKAFALAGITADQVRGFKTSSDALLALADRFKNIQDPIQKQAIGMQLLGRGSINLVGFLSKGSEAIKGLGVEATKLGLILSGKQIEALVDLEHALGKVWDVVKSLGATFTSYLAPTLTFIIEKYLKLFEANEMLIHLSIKDWAQQFVNILAYVAGFIAGLIQRIFDFSRAHEGLITTIGKVIIVVGSLTTILWGLSAVFGVLGTEIAIVEAPLYAVLAVVGALVLSFQALWELMHGKSLKDTWLGQIGELTKIAFDKLSSLAPTLGAPSYAVGAGSIGGTPGSAFPGLLQNLNLASGIGSSSPSLGQQPSNTNSTVLNQTNNISVAGGITPDETTKALQSAVEGVTGKDLTHTNIVTRGAKHY